MTTTTTAPALPALTVGARVRIEKGCNAREVVKGTTAQIKSITALGAEYSHAVRVTLFFVNGRLSGRTLTFYARHMNRLSDVIVGMNDGRPEHRIEVRRA